MYIAAGGNRTQRDRVGSPDRRSTEELLSQIIRKFKTSTWVPQCMAALVYSLGAQVQIVGIEEKLNFALTSAGIF